MSMEDEAAALADELRQRTAERDELAAECMALANRLKQTPEIRAIVGELRQLHSYLCKREIASARECVADLLRRLDESQ